MEKYILPSEKLIVECKLEYKDKESLTDFNFKVKQRPRPFWWSYGQPATDLIHCDRRTNFEKKHSDWMLYFKRNF